MKKLGLSAVMTVMALFAPVASFAIIDIGVYGGYTLVGNAVKPEVYNNAVGIIVHPSFTLAEVVTLGIGGYYQRSFDKKVVDYILYKRNKLVTKDSAGLDGYVQINIPKVNLHPYARFSTSIWDQMKGYRMRNYKNITASEFFKTYSVGGGLAIPFASAPVIEKVNLYLEYLYNISKVPGDKPRSHTLQAGIRVMI